MGMTITEKILANAAGHDKVKPGENIWVNANVLMTHDVCGPGTIGVFQREFGKDAKVWDKEGVVIIPDHYIFTEDKTCHRNVDTLREFVKEQDLPYFYDPADETYSGVCHVTLPEKGHIRPGEVLFGTDSHTCTHGALGMFATGIGNTDAGFVMGTGKLLIKIPPTIKFVINGIFPKGVIAKDVILKIIGDIGVDGATYCAMEFAGTAIEALSVEERMTICNMSIEGGARCGYINPDQITFDYLESRPYSPKGESWDKAVEDWKALASAEDADYDDEMTFTAADIGPTVTWGINPGQGITIDQKIPLVDDLAPELQNSAREALEYMDFQEGQLIEGTPVDVVFIGSCTNGRLSDLQEAANVLKGHTVAPGVTALCVPGSQIVAVQAEKLGLDKIFTEAGFQWRQAGCSMCLAMNPDKLVGRQLCASTSNRNFKGRQGSPTGRTILLSPIMAAAAAVEGKISDARKVFFN